MKVTLFRERTSMNPLDLAVAVLYNSEKKQISPKYSLGNNSLI